MRLPSFFILSICLTFMKVTAQVVPPLADGMDKFLGCCYGTSSKAGFANYWNQVTPENAGKWGVAEEIHDEMDWTELDEAYHFALENGFDYKHHCLIWGNQQPSWIAALDSAGQRYEIEQWYIAIANRYQHISQIDVVNEPLHDPPDDENDGGYLQALGGWGVTGWDWVIEAFRMADTLFPDTTMLLVNEYNITNDTVSTARYLELIRLLQKDSLIDGIGIQGHLFSHRVPNDIIRRNIDSLATTGLPIYITELDVDGRTDLIHVNTYMRIFPLFWEHPAVKGITLWGFRPGMWLTDQRAFLVDDQGNERPAMLWLRAYLNNNFVPNESVSISVLTGETTIDTDGGTLQFQATVLPEQSTLKTVDWSVSDRSIARIDKNGLLTALSDGQVTVRAISLELDSEIADEMVITISGQPAGTRDNAGNSMRIYPNPSEDGLLTIDGLNGNASIAILDLNGKQLLNYFSGDQPLVTLHTGLTSGLYIIRISDTKYVYYQKYLIR